MSAARQVIACFGEALVDLLAQPPTVPGAPRHYVEYAGGAPANVAAAVARLGGKARFIGMLGADMFGDFLQAQLTAFRVDTSDVRRTAAAPTALAFVALDRGGERHFSFYRPPAADLLFRQSDLRSDAFADVAVLHVCSNSLTDAEIAATTLALMRRARAAGAVVSMDVNLRPVLWPAAEAPEARLWQALHEAVIVKLCRFEANVLQRDAGDEAGMLARLWQGQTRLVLVTDGAAPMRWFSRDQHGICPTYNVQAIDTTAAGDACMGGLLQALVASGRSLDAMLADPAALLDMLRHGAASGALATTRHGAFAAMPDAAAVAGLMQARP